MHGKTLGAVSLVYNPISDMQCPNCSAQLTRGMGRVTQVRHSGENAISRQRKCDNCGHTWATAEVIVPDSTVHRGNRFGDYRIKKEVLDELVTTGSWFKQMA